MVHRAETVRSGVAVAVVSDAHLGGPGGEAAPLVEQLDALEVGSCSSVVFLGDLFHVWIGDERYETRQIADCFPAIERLVARGIETTYIEGNRDFFLLGSRYERGFTRVVQEHSFSVGEVRYTALHGDGINREDRNYLFWRWLSKSRLSRALFRRIPGPVARTIVHRTERHLASTNVEHRRKLPLGAIREVAHQRLQSCDVLLLGHFHRDYSEELAGGRVRVVDAWYQTPALLFIDERGMRYGQETVLEPSGSGRAAR